MKIEKIVESLKNYNLFVEGEFDLKVDYVSYDSRDIKENTLFVCKGVMFKEEYLIEAIKNGANSYVSEIKYNVDVPCILVNDIRKALSIISNTFYPDNLFKIGITGTKGKTTTNHFIHNILKEYLGFKPGIIATHYLYSGKEERAHDLTTPESLELHKYLKDMTDCDLKYMSMEASSQSVFHSRIFGMHFNIGVFLNISEDHISPLEHKDFDDYFGCKLKFLEMCDKLVVFNGTDHYDKVMDTIKDKEVITFGFKDADYLIENIQNNRYLSFDIIDDKKERHSYSISMLGRFNIINAAAAIVIAKQFDIDDETITRGLMNTFIPGRMNVVENDICPIIIDYAHNGLSAEALYKSLKEDFPNKKIKVLFGCPGNKGFNRRREMGLLAGKYADYVYLTAEDPGNSTVEEIANDIIKYISEYHTNYEVIEDREKAIEKAINELTSDDVLALLGKGDEQYQVIGNDFIPYDTDIVIVKKYLSKIKENA